MQRTGAPFALLIIDFLFNLTERPDSVTQRVCHRAERRAGCHTWCGRAARRVVLRRSLGGRGRLVQRLRRRIEHACEAAVGRDHDEAVEPCSAQGLIGFVWQMRGKGAKCVCVAPESRRNALT